MPNPEPQRTRHSISGLHRRLSPRAAPVGNHTLITTPPTAFDSEPSGYHAPANCQIIARHKIRRHRGAAGVIIFPSLKTGRVLASLVQEAN